MWRRSYLLLLLIRVYFAFSASYLHPDENFQGPEVFANRIYSYPAKLTWEFTSTYPIRSIFPLWLLYGWPMTLLKWFWTETGGGNSPPPPQLVYYVLRGTMFILSFVLEDWAIHELMTNSPRRRRQAVVLVASSYVTWTYQVHTFSNSLETLLVVWGLVLIQRITDDKNHSSIFACAILAFIAVLGVFNRITFPAFFLIPGLKLVPHLLRKPFSLITLVSFGLLFSFVAIYIDTDFYSTSPLSLTTILRNPVITPLNNLLYNSDTTNLATHGLHPRYQHFLVNLPQLLGPAFILLLLQSLPTRGSFSSSYFHLKNPRAISALSGAFIISTFPHQEPRFLLPCIPLLLTCLRPPRSRLFVASWIIFNAALGVLMGTYHQGGVIPVQLQIPTILANATVPQASLSPPIQRGTASVFWWKTYSPPQWLIGDVNNIFTITTNNDTAAALFPFSSIETTDLMGIRGTQMLNTLNARVQNCTRIRRTSAPVGDDKPLKPTDNPTLLVAPYSATFLDTYAADNTTSQDTTAQLRLHRLWSYKRHINLDDLDFGDDGVISTLQRAVGRRGLDVWLVTRDCQ
ncbi:hypothetical protein AJ80_08160 [Polytolypa hystricis UAMH7299]|uniref:Mannosyltransferase n=1 Tax=Polytolypa hystricis (strain UAMH7299) TaxID=1447883 RepID=A0A2B7XBI7_POLH7|nr:hypothetical protein AJ80_08160 [Polytolypa hystricis UAMH7299]